MLTPNYASLMAQPVHRPGMEPIVNRPAAPGMERGPNATPRRTAGPLVRPELLSAVGATGATAPPGGPIDPKLHPTLAR